MPSISALTPPQPAQIKSISGQMITWVNEHCDWINPEEPKGCSWLVGRPIRAVMRLIVGIVCGFFGGLGGTFWHGGAMIGNCFLAVKNRSMKDLKDAGKHGLSCLSDLFRMATGGITSGIHYASAPDHFFGRRHSRREDDDAPIRIEVLAPLAAIVLCMESLQCC